MSSYDLENGIFSKIVRGEIPATVVFQDEFITAFRDIHPQAKTHILIIPNKCIPTLNHIELEDALLLGKMLLAAKELAKMEGIDQSGYRVIMNCLEDAGQEVFHIHLHLLGGEKLGPLNTKRNV